jgi:hypothetical protein
MLLIAGAAGAQYLRGRDLLDLCARHGREEPNLTEADVVRDVASTGTCRGYLMGVVDWLEREPAAGVCLPRETTLGELLNAVRGYGERHPEDLGESASRLVAGALRRSYPCAPPEPARGRR